MSGPNDPSPPKALTSKELTAFFERVGASDKCPMCPNNQWHLASDETFRHLVPTLPDKSGKQYGVHVHVMLCSNCGFVRQHASLILEGGLAPKDGEEA